MCDESLLHALLQQIADHSKEVFGGRLQSVILYGSYARGDYNDESDIDVMILVDMPPEELSKYRWEFSCFCADLNVENDVLIASKLQSAPIFDKWKNTLPFYRNVIKDGVGYA